MKNPKRENRKRVANIVLENPLLFKDLIVITFGIQNKDSIKAAWILEWICTHHHLGWIAPYLEDFSTKIAALQLDSAIRPCAKICEHLAIEYTSIKKNIIQKKITKHQIDLIIETGFDWLITPQKIAVKAYTMTFLYLFGLEKDWVHPELEHIIRTKTIHQSKGCEARGKKILTLIKKNHLK